MQLLYKHLVNGYVLDSVLLTKLQKENEFTHFIQCLHRAQRGDFEDKKRKIKNLFSLYTGRGAIHTKYTIRDLRVCVMVDYQNNVVHSWEERSL